MKIIVDTMFSYVDFEHDTLLREKVQEVMHKELGIKVEGAFYSRAYRSGYWDGITDFYDMEEDKFHTGLLPQFLNGLRKIQQNNPTFTYEIEDVREPQLVHPDSIDKEIVLGNGEEEPITLRDYQYESVKAVFEEKMGILNLATNAGKCLPEYSELLTSEGIMTLGDFIEKAGLELTDKEKIYYYTGDVSLINRYGKKEKPKHITFNGVRKVNKVTTESGLVLTQTLNHPLLTLQPTGEFKWVNAGKLREGDMLVARIGDNVFGSDTTVESEEEAYILGVIIADGYIGKNSTMHVINKNPEVLNLVEDYFKSLSSSVSRGQVKKRKNSTTEIVKLNDVEATRAWQSKYGVNNLTAQGKEIPKCILQAPKNIQLAFLSGYTECSGAISVSKLCLDIITASGTLANQLSLVLRNLGILVYNSNKRVTGYSKNQYRRLSLGSVDSKKFLGLLTFKTPSRSTKVTEFNEVFNSRKRNNKKDTLPYGKQIGEAYRDSIRVHVSGLRKKFSIPKTISKTRLRNLVDEFPQGDTSLLTNIIEITDDKYVYEKVVGIEEGEPVRTFDVHMPKTNSFIAEGVVNHNTEAAAGVMQQILPYLKRGERIAFFTHSRELFNQTALRIAKRLNLKENQIGKIGDGKFSIKNKQIVFVMIPTLNSALKDPKKGLKFTHKERVIKFIAEEIAPKFKNTKNTRQLLRNYIKNCRLTTKVWESALEHLQYIAYDSKFSDKTAQLQLNKYVVEFDKIMEKKNKTKYKKYKDTVDFLKTVRVMIADESHHAKADTWFNNLSLCTNADYRVGLTGTVDKKDKMGWQRLQALFGQIISKVENDYLIEKGVSSKPIIRLVPITEPRNIELINNYLEAYKAGIVENDTRNEVIVKLAEGYKKRKPGGVLISVKEIEHGNRILELFKERELDADFIHGGSEESHRTGTLDKFSKGKLDILIASTIIDEGVDMKSIGCMVLAAGGKSMRQQLQRIGRGLRLNGIDGNSVMVFDFIDYTNKYLYNHSKERIKIFKDEKFDVKQLGS